MFGDLLVGQTNSLKSTALSYLMEKLYVLSGAGIFTMQISPTKKNPTLLFEKPLKKMTAIDICLDKEYNHKMSVLFSNLLGGVSFFPIVNVFVCESIYVNI